MPFARMKRFLAVLLLVSAVVYSQTRQVPNLGGSANDGTGDSLRTFGQKVANNESNLFNAIFTNGPAARVVDSVADLVAFTGFDGVSVATLGYYTPGDGGGGLYRWTNGVPAVTNALGGALVVTGGAWVLDPSQPLNVRQFGAKGDDATDDGASINAALAYARDVNGSLFLPAGVYRTSVSLDARRLVGASTNALSKITGAGMQLTTVKATSDNIPVLRVSGRYFQLADFELTYSNFQTAAHTNSNALQLEDWVFFSDFDRLLLSNGYTGFNVIEGDDVSQEAIAFSCRFGTIRALNNYYAGVRIGRTTGNIWENLYISAQLREQVVRLLEIHGKFQEAFVQLNLEQANLRDAAMVVHDKSDNVAIQSMHLEGLSLFTHGSAFNTNGALGPPGGLAGAFVVYAGRGTLNIEALSMDRCYVGAPATTLTASGTTVTATVQPWDTDNSTGHGISVGDTVTIAGASDTNYNGAVVVTGVPSPWTYTYEAAFAPASSTAVPSADYITGYVGNAGAVNCIFRTASRPRSINVQSLRIRDMVVRGNNGGARSGAFRFLDVGALIDCPLVIENLNYEGQWWQSSMMGALSVVAGQRANGVGYFWTAYEHGLAAGDQVFIAACAQIGGFNGLHTVVSVPTPYSVEIALAGTTAYTQETAGYVIRRDIQTASRSRSGNIATIETSVAHRLRVGTRLAIQGLGGTGYNDIETAVLTIPTSTSFTYWNTGADEGATADTAGSVMVIDVGIAPGTVASPLARNALVTAGKLSVPWQITTNVALSTISGAVTVTGIGRPNTYQHYWAASGNANLVFSSLVGGDTGTIFIPAASTNVTLTLTDAFAYSPSGSTLTVTGGTNNWSVVAWEARTINSTNVVLVNLGDYSR